MLKPRNIPDLAKEVEESAGKPEKLDFVPSKGDFQQVLSTGSTLLDLAISGRRIRGGGVPGGIVVEIAGESGTGKTGILSEICSSAQAKGGLVKFRDPEGRLDKEYSLIYGIDIKTMDYDRPDTVEEIFAEIQDWPEKDSNIIDVYGCDSIAALSTELEMEDGDPFGGRRAKMFSQELRKTARIIGKNNRLVVFTNQLRDVIGASMFQKKKESPGGNAVKFYSSLRLEVVTAGKIKKKSRYQGKEIEKIIGVNSRVRIIKSSIDNPFREAVISIIFGYGIDDIRDNLQFVKEHSTDKKFAVINDCEGFSVMEKAIEYIEANNLQTELREKVVNIWEEIESKFTFDRKPKARL